MSVRQTAEGLVNHRPSKQTSSKAKANEAAAKENLICPLQKSFAAPMAMQLAAEWPINNNYGIVAAEFVLLSA